LGFLLGFSENAALLHAFRRWTGSTPMRYRAANRGDHASAATRPPVASRHGRGLKVQAEREERISRGEYRASDCEPRDL
jgi:AraC-like DNA-binding protein